MILVPTGEFPYGDNNQCLSLHGFYMDKYEVTTARYAQFLQASGREVPSALNEILVNDGKRPMNGVNWYEAGAYCRYYGKRLPTEQEWEKAARGTDGRIYPWGNEEPTKRHANFGKCCDWKGYSGTFTVVGSLEAGASRYGIYDMAGNVGHWTSSDYDSNKKVIRGESWASDANHLRSTSRSWNGASLRDGYSTVGFRCVQDDPLDGGRGQLGDKP